MHEQTNSFVSPQKSSHGAFVHRINSNYIKNQKQKPNPKKNTPHYYENTSNVGVDAACCEKRIERAISVKSDVVKDIRLRLDVSNAANKIYSPKRSLVERNLNFQGKYVSGGMIIVTPQQAANYRERQTTFEGSANGDPVIGNTFEYKNREDGVLVDAT